MDSTPKQPTVQDSDGLAWVLRYAAQGWQVFPCWRTDARGICLCPKAEKCGNPGKHPRTHHGFKDATSEPKKIKAWRWATANVGVRTGQESGLVVIDIDPRHGGQASLRALLERLGELPRGPIARTGGGGWHLPFRYPGRTVSSRNGIVGGIDIKGDGRLFIAPPSIHRSGNAYSWQIPPDGFPLPELPPAWVDFLAGENRCCAECAESAGSTEDTEVSEVLRNAPEVTSAGSPDGDRAAAIADIVKSSLPTTAGERHDKIFELVRRLKALPDLAVKPADALLEIVQQWHELALEKIGTKEFEPTWADFRFGWEECKYPWGTGPMEEIFGKAIKEEPPAKAVTLYGRNALRTRLAALCRALQRVAGTEPFFLSSRQVGNLLNVSPMHGWRWLRQFCEDKLLRQASKGTLKDHQASEFNYLGD
jgi:hypothetical protein